VMNASSATYLLAGLYPLAQPRRCSRRCLKGSASGKSCRRLARRQHVRQLVYLQYRYKVLCIHNMRFAGLLASSLAVCTLLWRAQAGSGSRPERHSQTRKAAARPAPAPQAPQQPVLQRPERFVERGPPPPPKVGPITTALERESSGAQRGNGGQRKAPGGRRGTQQWPREGRTLMGWRAQAQRVGNSVGAVNKAMVQLQHVRGADVEADASGVMRDALQLLQSDVDAGDERLASFLEALGSAVQAHKPLASTAADAGASARVAQALDRAAQQEATYTNAFCTAQMATAQEKLRQYCARFWRDLEDGDRQHADAQCVATLLHRASVLATEHGAPAPNEALWELLESGIVATAPDMNEQDVANCWYAYAKLAQPEHAVGQVLSEALVRVCHGMVPQAVNNALWAFAKLAKLGHAVHAGVRDALLAAALRTASRMEAQEVANTWWAVAKLGWPVRDQLRTTLLATAQQKSQDMNAQEVANVWYAFALLGVRPQGEPHDALAAAAVLASADVKPQVTANILWALAKLGLPLSVELQAVLVLAVSRVSEQMTRQDAANAV
jgi:hypothetical protein